MGKRLTLTFKDSEQWIYDEVMKHSGKSNWIKDVMANYILDNGKEKTRPGEPVGLIDDDFSIIGGL